MKRATAAENEPVVLGSRGACLPFDRERASIFYGFLLGHPRIVKHHRKGDINQAFFMHTMHRKIPQIQIMVESG